MSMDFKENLKRKNNDEEDKKPNKLLFIQNKKDGVVNIQFIKVDLNINRNSKDVEIIGIN